jgi:SAM-dependent methyltransferase
MTSSQRSKFEMASLKDKVPWPLKIGAKLVLSRIPVQYSFWRRLHLFDYGPMHQPEYAFTVFRTHLERTGFAQRREGFVFLELGPGDSLFSAMNAYAFGASASFLVDAGDFAIKDLEPYRGMADFLIAKRLPVPDMASTSSLKELLAACAAQYKTSGLSSLRSMPDKSVDLIWSQAVLEHVRRDEFLDVSQELRRIIRDNGACSHTVDLRDHLDNALNNLRFSKTLWESNVTASSGFYTNRIRYSEMLELFRQTGWKVEVVNADRWPKLPTPRAKLSVDFKRLPEEELRVSTFNVVLWPE